MPPQEQEPAWPSDDSDGAAEGATAQLPVPDGQRTAQLPAPPRVAEQPTVWVPRPVEPRQPGRPATPQQQPRPPQPPQQPPQQQQPPSQQQQPSQQPQQPPQQQPQAWPQQAPPRPIPPASAANAQPMRIEPTGETHVAGQVTGESPAPPAPPSRRKRRGLIFGGLALLLVIAVGVAAGLPYVSNRLGLPWAPNLPKGDEPRPAVLNLALQPPSPSAPTPTDSGVATALSGPAHNLELGTLTGAVIDPATGTTLWDHNSSQLLTPASTTKLLTTSAALLTLDHGLQLSTRVVAGSSPDTVILVAGGDPTLSSLPDGKDSIFPGAAHLDDLVAQVRKAAGGRVKKVQIDTSIYSGEETGPGWDPADAPSTYAAPMVPAMLDGGMTDPADEHSQRVADPAGALLQQFAARLGATAAGPATAPKGAKVLGEVRSAPLTELIDTALQLSDNTLAEAIGRQTAIAAGAPASFAGVAATVKKVLSQNGFDVSTVQLSDGSGLSTQDKVPAKLLAQLLAVAAAPDGKDERSPKLRPLLEGLPVAGGSGTLSTRYGDPGSAAGRGWVRAKTGTLSGVNTLAGVVLDSDGRVLVFALMSNAAEQARADPIRAALDVVATALRGCGCR